jgi:hypothetical protein
VSLYIEKKTDREGDIKKFDKVVLPIQYVITQKRYGVKNFKNFKKSDTRV